jgi:adenylate kinase family enzyme
LAGAPVLCDARGIVKRTHRFAIIGNAGSGKSTLAWQLAGQLDLALLDLDIVAWEPDRIAVPRSHAAATADVQAFCRSYPEWVVEGCYPDLIGTSLAYRPHLLLLDPGIDQCLSNCRARPWEPHKYRSRAEQDRKLGMLLAWVADYYHRDGDISLQAHEALFEAYRGPKQRLSRLPGPDFRPRA